MFLLRRPVWRSTAHVTVQAPPNDPEVDTDESEESNHSDMDADVPHGVPVATTVMAPSRPEDDGMGDYYWQAVILTDTSTIVQMQRENKWRVGSVVPPLFLHVWLRLPRGDEDPQAETGIGMGDPTV